MNVPPYGDTLKKALLDLATLRVTAQDTPNMTVKISAGGFWNYTSTGASYIEYAGGSSATISTPGSNAKWTLVTINSSGVLVNIDGTIAASPVLPTLPRGRFPLAAIYITASDTTITNDMIYDVRPYYELAVRDHRDLESNAIAGSHPASAITFTPGGSGLSSTNIQDVILELKTLFDDLYAHAGTSGTSGTSGSGTSGTSGVTGTSGTSGISGTSGTSGIDGTSGTSGIDGTSGTSGTTGTSGTSGISGTSGTSA